MQEPSVDDASLSQDPNMNMPTDNDPNAGGPMGGEDPNMGGPMGDMGNDPNAGGPMGGEDPNIGGPMGDEDPNMGGGDDTLSIINKLSDKDKEAVRSYAESMLSRDETQQNGGEEQPMMEQVIFTKKQINKIQENFGPTQDELMNKNNRKELPKKQSKTNNSPFSNPKFMN